MHSLIFQVCTSPIDMENNYLTDENVYAGDMTTIDYVDDVPALYVDETIDILVNNILPKGMFTSNNDRTLTYNGGYEEWSKGYCQLLKDTCSELTPENMKDYIFKLTYILLNPLNTEVLFVDSCEGVAERSANFMDIVKYLKKGDKVYIGKVFDYHA